MDKTEVRLLPQEYLSKSTTNIYDNKIAIMLWSENPIGILVKSEEIANSHNKRFEFLWKEAEK